MASASVQVQNFVGKEVNGFEIIKLIGKILICLTLTNRPREIFIRVQSPAEK